MWVKTIQYTIYKYATKQRHIHSTAIPTANKYNEKNKKSTIPMINSKRMEKINIVNILLTILHSIYIWIFKHIQLRSQQLKIEEEKKLIAQM